MRRTTPDLGRVESIVRSHLRSGDYQVFLFGSRARGDARERSDWDIGILGAEEVPGHVLEAIHADLEELPTLHRFDVVDLHSTSDSFRTHALKEIVPL
jgi:predicted nucleotidyltransferase